MLNRPAVGVAVIIIKEEKVLLGKRLNAHGQGTWAFPGGHLELNESILACAQREVREETGMQLSGIEHVAFTNDIFNAEKKHYITLFVKSTEIYGIPRVMEPHKCEKWEWFSRHSLPEPRFLSLQNLLGQEGIPWD